MFKPVSPMFNPFEAAETIYCQYGNFGPKLVISGAKTCVRTKPGNTFAIITLATHACTNFLKIQQGFSKRPNMCYISKFRGFKDIKYDNLVCHEGHEDISLSACLCISLHFSTFHCISLQFSVFLCISLHFSAFLYISLYFSACLCMSLHFSAFLYISLHFTVFHCIPLHSTAFLCIYHFIF